jgi:hypothetical protein
MRVLREQALAAVLVLGIVACQGGETKQVSSSSHWFECDAQRDCLQVAGAVACRQGRCVDALGAPIPRPDAAVGGEVSDTGPGPDAADDGDGAAGSDAAETTPSADAANATSCRQREYAAPTLDKSCTTADDCFGGFHVADCCGSLLALAYNHAEQAAFRQYELDCAENPCPCPARPAQAEDGSPLAPGVEAIVECAGGMCLARGPAAADCSGEMECIDAQDGGACVPALGPVGNARCRDAQGLCVGCRCASPETPIATPRGDRPIASLGVGDLVYSIDGAAVAVVPIVRISRVAAFQHRVVRVRLKNGATLEISAGHPTADGRSFAMLRAGDELGGVAIVATEIVDYAHAFTYDILPASSSGSYFAGGVPVGSTLF